MKRLAMLWWRPTFGMQLEFEPRHLLVGLSWKRTLQFDSSCVLDVWVCLLPTLPLHLWWFTDPPWRTPDVCLPRPARTA